ncbi:MAG: serine/threonine protein kinase, partial [Kofleriaceae bacterium]|nr:serine/threonine protein kinase [Kofleriaceae bacterium]
LLVAIDAPLLHDVADGRRENHDPAVLLAELLAGRVRIAVVQPARRDARDDQRDERDHSRDDRHLPRRPPAVHGSILYGYHGAMSSDADDPGTAETQELPPESRVLRERPRADKLVRDVARNKIAAALFATSEQTVIGRYRLLERVGVGGMGVVWGAWDPQLERRVALKLVKVKTDNARDRMLAEGQTLAKLSHPNVVPIYDVGTFEDQIYLVMEWIRGQNLRAYCAEPRSTREILRVYRAAGDGLVAAHREGIIHRDFKPDNVMVGEDGRVRVLDFGLARAESDAPAEVAGTPRYMAPEQTRGETLTAAVDQFAFCVSLRESLSENDGTVPGWVATIVARGSAPAADDRFRSMETLLHALARDPRSVWRRRVLALGAVAAAGGAFAIGTTRSRGPEPCAGSAAELAPVWNEAARVRILLHGSSLGPYGLAESQYLDGALTAYSQRWVAARRGACLAHRRDELTPRLYENTLACIQRARGALGAVADVLGRASIEKYSDAVLAARALPDVDRCVLDATESQVQPPDPSIAGVVHALGTAVSGARFQALAGDPKSLAVAEPLAASAEQIGYAPLIAQAQLALAAALATDQLRLDKAVVAYLRSATAALGASDDVLFVEAFARALFAAGRLADENMPAEAKDLGATVPFAEVLAQRAGKAGAFARTLFYNNVGTTRLAAGDNQGAERWFRRARDELRAGATGAELAPSLGNLATVVASRSERDALFAEERALLERTVGATHALTLQERLRAAVYLEHARDGARALSEICQELATWYPYQRERIAKCRYNSAWLAIERGDLATARTDYESVAATEIHEADHARAQLALLDGHAGEADRLATALAEETGKHHSWFSRFPASVDAWLIAADARIALGKPDAAIAALRAALAIMDDSHINQGAARVQRRLARVRAELAMLLATRERKEAVLLAQQAIAWSRAAGGYEERVAALERLTGSN